MQIHAYACPYPEGCNCGASETNRRESHVVRLERENAELRDAALTLAATGTLLLRDHALLLPPEQQKWEEACGKLNRALG